jgi:NAD(P)-dependent dehydrogenase (short-subunit alcohol dehydrogenase family)
MTADGIVLVTGGSRGNGAATATLLANQGRRVVIVDITPGPLADTRTVLWPAPFDVASEGAVVSGVADIETAPTAMSRLVEPIEVAQAIAWLLSPMSSGITSINLPVDAGFIAGST